VLQPARRAHGLAGYAISTYPDDTRAPTAAPLAEFHRSGARLPDWLVGDNLGGATFLLAAILIAGTTVGLATALISTPT
jgi:hypothetical protein